MTKADLFRSLHTAAHPLVLVNAWDVASARIAEQAGSSAVATTSAGVAWSLGAPDGNALDRDQAIGLITRVANAVTVPVTADIEAGFGETAADVAQTISLVLRAGAVGVNIEDASHQGLLEIDDQCTRLAAARKAADEAGIALFINARIDTYLRGQGGVAETLQRATAYLSAGADGIFVPGVSDADTIAGLARDISAPLNIMAGPGALSVAELGRLGVARISLGSSVAQAAYGVVQRTAVEALSAGTYDSLAGGLDYPSINSLL